MKRIINFSAALLAMCMVSCTKEQMSIETADSAKVRTITCSYEQTKSSISNDFKTTWNAGDKVWLSNGTTTETVTVGDAYDGLDSFAFETALEGTLYAVYPASAASKVDGGTIVYKIGAAQDGTFASANIATATTTTTTLAFQNATALLKVPATGLCLVTIMADAPIAGTSASLSGNLIKVAVPDAADYVYAAVPAGTLNASFTAYKSDMTYKTRAMASSQTVDANGLYALPDALFASFDAPAGTGTAGDPYLMKTTEDMTALACYVNSDENHTMEGKYVKVVNDIDPIILNIGQCINNTDYYFKGNFDGNNHTLNLDLSALNAYVGLFGDCAEGVNIHDLTLTGKVVGNGKNDIAALIGCLNAGAGATISNITNNATVTGNNTIGGIIAYMDGVATISDCTNNANVTGASYAVGGIIGYKPNDSKRTVLTNVANTGAIKGQYEVGGISGYAAYVTVNNASNNGKITATKFNSNYGSACGGILGLGIQSPVNTAENNGDIIATGTGATYSYSGGVIGWANNSTVTNGTNNGNVSALTRTGGIMGYAEWSHAKNCTNTGSVTGTGASIGGITGYVKTRADHTNCVNTGTISGSSWTGGIIAFAYNQSSGNYILVSGSRNSGSVTATGNAVGGILGGTQSYYGATITECINTGNVSGKCQIGGILGYGNKKSTTDKWTVINSYNEGTITSTRSDDGGEVAGGIVGTCEEGGKGLHLFNCYNKGNILYSGASHKLILSGGIVGRLQTGSEIVNVYNSGEIRPVSGPMTDAAAIASSGSLVGSLEGTSTISVGAFLEGTSSNAYGAYSGKPLTTGSATNVSSHNAGGILASQMEINSTMYDNYLDALNANTSNIAALTLGKKVVYTWAAGPVFVTE